MIDKFIELENKTYMSYGISLRMRKIILKLKKDQAIDELTQIFTSLHKEGNITDTTTKCLIQATPRLADKEFMVYFDQIIDMPKYKLN